MTMGVGMLAEITQRDAVWVLVILAIIAVLIYIVRALK